MHYQQYGSSGKTIVFLLGANNKPSFYESFFQKLGQHYRVFVITYSGIGNSDKFAEHTLTNYLDYIHKIIKDEVQAHEFYLAGFSLGGYLAVKYFHLHKEKIAGLILLSPMFKLRSRSLISLMGRFILNEFQRLRSANRGDVYSILSPRNLYFFATRQKHSRFITNLPALTPEEMADITNYIAVVGKRDYIVDSDQVLKLLKIANTAVYEKSGHDGFALEPESTLKLIQDFVK